MDGRGLGVVGARLPHIVEDGAKDQVPERHHGCAALPSRDLISLGKGARVRENRHLRPV